MLRRLEEELGYRLENADDLEIFLDHHRELFDPLVQASSAVQDFFPNRTATELHVSKDYEADDSIVDGNLFVIIHLPRLTYDERTKLLDAFFDQWYLTVSRDSRPAREITFDLTSDVFVD
jgi:hypothetical protein